MARSARRWSRTRKASPGLGEVRWISGQAELPRYYDLADVLVLPSEWEPWGLVVNEAMSAGCAMMASDRVAAAADLVHPGENGATFRSGGTPTRGEDLARDRRARTVGDDGGAKFRLDWPVGFRQDQEGIRTALTSYNWWAPSLMAAVEPGTQSPGLLRRREDHRLPYPSGTRPPPRKSTGVRPISSIAATSVRRLQNLMWPPTPRVEVAVPAACKGEREVLQVPVIRRRDHQTPSGPQRRCPTDEECSRVVEVFDHFSADHGVERLDVEALDDQGIARHSLKPAPGMRIACDWMPS